VKVLRKMTDDPLCKIMLASVPLDRTCSFHFCQITNKRTPDP
jgi:hypothetical protein